MVMSDRWFGFRESLIPIARLSYWTKMLYNIIYIMMISWISDLYLRWIIIWLTTSNHYHWSWDDCTMSTSSSSQVSNILPISILVFGYCWYASRWTICIAANDQDTFICLTRGVLWYSEFTLYAYDFKICIIGLSIKKSTYLLLLENG